MPDAYNPYFGEHVYVKRRLKQKRQPNGYVIRLSYSEQEAVVKFYSCDVKGALLGGDTESIDFNEFTRFHQGRETAYWIIVDD